MQVRGAYFFLLDKRNNIVISDYSAHAIKVFSEKGSFLHTIGEHGFEAGMFDSPYGIAINNNNKLVCVSNNNNYGLQIFS